MVTECCIFDSGDAPANPAFQIFRMSNDKNNKDCFVCAETGSFAFRSSKYCTEFKSNVFAIVIKMSITCRLMCLSCMKKLQNI